MAFTSVSIPLQTIITSLARSYASIEDYEEPTLYMVIMHMAEDVADAINPWATPAAREEFIADFRQKVVYHA
jgi:hypothetical protein